MTQKEDNFKSYLLNEIIIINNIEFREIVINSECQKKHPDITDEVILELVKQLNGENFFWKEGKDSWKYFEFEPFLHQNKAYRLVWCWDENQSFLGIQNCFRRRKYDKK